MTFSGCITDPRFVVHTINTLHCLDFESFVNTAIDEGRLEFVGSDTKEDALGEFARENFDDMVVDAGEIKIEDCGIM